MNLMNSCEICLSWRIVAMEMHSLTSECFIIMFGQSVKVIRIHENENMIEASELLLHGTATISNISLLNCWLRSHFEMAKITISSLWFYRTCYDAMAWICLISFPIRNELQLNWHQRSHLSRWLKQWINLFDNNSHNYLFIKVLFSEWLCNF